MQQWKNVFLGQQSCLDVSSTHSVFSGATSLSHRCSVPCIRIQWACPCRSQPARWSCPELSQLCLGLKCWSRQMVVAERSWTSASGVHDRSMFFFFYVSFYGPQMIRHEWYEWRSSNSMAPSCCGPGHWWEVLITASRTCRDGWRWVMTVMPSADRKKNGWSSKGQPMLRQGRNFISFHSIDFGGFGEPNWHLMVFVFYTFF